MFKFQTIKKHLAFALILIFSLSFTHFAFAHGEAEEHAQETSFLEAGNQAESKTAVIYYNEACGMCASYVHNELPVLLNQVSINNFIKNDYINEKDKRLEMNQVMDKLNIPLPLQSHIMTFVGDKYILGGHIPEHLIQAIFKKENSQKFKRIIVYQDLMHGDIEDYKIWAIPSYADNFVGEIKTYPINTPLSEYLDFLSKNRDTLKSNSASINKSQKAILPIVLVSGFLDGLNPCAFAVLLFFIAFLFTLKRSLANIWKMGLIYISAIYLAYLLIGFGIFKAILFINSPHFMAKLGSWLIIVLGSFSIISYFFPRFPIKIRLPHASRDKIHAWMRKGAMPAAFVMGFLVGLCTFPCSGGIYVAIIGLLAAKATYWSGVGYMLLYNLMFVAPLIIMLIIAANKYFFVKASAWQQAHKKTQKLVTGILMLLLGIIILTFFI